MRGLFEGVAVTPDDEKMLTPALANWLTLQNAMVTDDWPESMLIKAMLSERRGRNRMSILNRLYSRYSRVRTERERRELIAGEVTP